VNSYAPGMVTDSRAHHSRQRILQLPSQSRVLGVVVSNRKEDDAAALGVNVMFEPGRAAGEYIALAYNLLVPIARRQVRVDGDSTGSDAIRIDQLIGGRRQ
jgi:hypothetical protein